EMERVSTPAFQAEMAASPAAAAYRDALAQAQRNLAVLSEAGASVAFGTDSGPAARFPGYFEHMEMALMAQSGMSAEDILKSATGVAAGCLGLDDVGTLEAGRWADFLVLDADPMDDVAALRSLEAVYVGGSRIP
ncbi:MAG: amidohydrolase family protein, partial [Gemmatimonadota bacterium]|nr:amidohydrolase family protein [Gemmatimonadota bacterium]